MVNHAVTYIKEQIEDLSPELATQVVLSEIHRLEEQIQELYSKADIYEAIASWAEEQVTRLPAGQNRQDKVRFDCFYATYLENLTKSEQYVGLAGRTRETIGELEVLLLGIEKP